MDNEDFIHNVFTTDHLWKPSRFSDDPASYESSLFLPIQLDGGSRRVSVFTRRELSNPQQCPQSISTTHMGPRKPSIANCSFQILRHLSSDGYLSQTALIYRRSRSRQTRRKQRMSFGRLPWSWAQYTRTWYSSLGKPLRILSTINSTRLTYRNLDPRVSMQRSAGYRVDTLTSERLSRAIYFLTPF